MNEEEARKAAELTQLKVKVGAIAYNLGEKLVRDDYSPLSEEDIDCLGDLFAEALKLGYKTTFEVTVLSRKASDASSAGEAALKKLTGKPVSYEW